MEDEAVEFRCTDCDTPVPPDAHSCPNCGVAFDEPPPQEELEFACTECGAAADPREKACPRCGAMFYPEYYSVTSTKIALLSICSLGLYHFYWFYRNWRLVKEQERRRMIPILRAMFPYFFCFQLFRKVLGSARWVGYKQSYPPGVLAITYILMLFLYKLPGPTWLAGLFSYVPLLPVQQAINFNNSKVSANFLENSKFSAGEITLVICGGMIVLIGAVHALSQ